MHERICIVCKNGQVEDEEHFLLKCDTYDSLSNKYKFEHLKTQLVFSLVTTSGKYLIEAFKLRGNN